MPIFAYKAIDKSGKEISDEFEVASYDEAIFITILSPDDADVWSDCIFFYRVFYSLFFDFLVFCCIPADIINGNGDILFFIN